MHEEMQIGYKAFISDGGDAVGVVRDFTKHTVVIYVENAGDFTIAKNSVLTVHSQKVILDSGRLDHSFLKAVDHAHDREDPKLVG